MTPEETIIRILKSALNQANRSLMEITEEVAGLRREAGGPTAAATDAVAAGVTAERRRVIDHLACAFKNEPKISPGLRVAMAYIADGTMLTDKGRARYACSYHENQPDALLYRQMPPMRP